MENDNNSQKQIRIPVTKADTTELITQLTAENIRLRQENEELKCTIDKLINVVEKQNETIQQLKDEIARLNKRNPKPKIPPSKLEGNKKPKLRDRITKLKNSLLYCFSRLENLSGLSERCYFTAIALTLTSRIMEISTLARRLIKRTKRQGSKPGQPKGKRRKKKTVLEIHETKTIPPVSIPENANFKGYQPYTVQDIKFIVHNTRYFLERWELPDGSYVTGELPDEIQGHYGPDLKAYVLHQYHNCRVTQNLILEELHARGVLISSGQLNNILIQYNDSLHEEVSELLQAGVEAEGQLQVDDTGGRHKGKNQYTTVIGNSWFTIYATTDSKSRINFLKLLQGGKEEYLINEDTIEFLKAINDSSYLPGYIALSIGSKGRKFTSSDDWKKFLDERNITSDLEVRIVTEAALFASVISNGIPRNLGVHSDDAGQFYVFYHSLCWIHEERHYRKLIMTTPEFQADLDRVRDQIWKIYKNLKEYKETPSEEKKEAIEKEFDEIFQQNTLSPTLNHQLNKTYKKKEELLRVLQRHTTPLHNNSSETAARAAKIKLKVSGGTRSDLGRQARDTFLSIKQTCLKLEINIISFLQDRVRGLFEIPKLAEIIRQRSSKATAPPHPS